jgi:hypothetical protein
VCCVEGFERSPRVRALGRSPIRRQNFSAVVTLCREKDPASMAVIAMRSAAEAVSASKAVTNVFSFLRLPDCKGFASGRLTLARHLPGARTKALTINALYSTPSSPPVFSTVLGYSQTRKRRLSAQRRKCGDVMDSACRWCSNQEQATETDNGWGCTPGVFFYGIRTHYRHKKEPRRRECSGLFGVRCLNVGFWAGRQGVGGGGAARAGLLIAPVNSSPCSFNARSRAFVCCCFKCACPTVAGAQQGRNWL